eukprot:1219033-Pleurochrysis_carterae.AAC.2
MSADDVYSVQIAAAVAVLSACDCIARSMSGNEKQLKATRSSQPQRGVREYQRLQGSVQQDGGLAARTVARKWLENNYLWWCKVQRRQKTYWHHFRSFCRQPAGRADGSRGSQQCCFEMKLWNKQLDHMMDLEHEEFTRLSYMQYSINQYGEIEWLRSRSMSTCCMHDRHRSPEHSQLHSISRARGCEGCGSIRQLQGGREPRSGGGASGVHTCATTHHREVSALARETGTVRDLQPHHVQRPGRAFASSACRATARASSN